MVAARKTVIEVTARATPYTWELLTLVCGIGALLASRGTVDRQYGDLLNGGTILFTGISMIDLRAGIRSLHATVRERLDR
jgi:hypothetical protein